MAALCVISSAPMTQNIFSRVITVLVEMSDTSVMCLILTTINFLQLTQDAQLNPFGNVRLYSPLLGFPRYGAQ